MLRFSKLLVKLEVKYVSAYKGYTLKEYQQKADDVYAILFSDFLYKSICCEYSFELHRQVDVIKL